jgi:hypothetical protein
MMLRAGGIKPAAIHIRAFMAESSAPLLIIPTVIARLAAFAKASAGLKTASPSKPVDPPKSAFGRRRLA